MKALLILLLSSSFAIYNTLLYKQSNYEPVTGLVDKEKGLYIFCNSRPTLIYESIGKVKAGLTMSGTYSQLKNSLINKALKNYPTAEAIIIDTEDNCATAEVIKFK